MEQAKRLTPIVSLLRSRKFQAAVLGLLTVLLTRYLGIRDPEVVTSITALTVAVILGIAGEDMATKSVAQTITATVDTTTHNEPKPPAKGP